MSHHCHYVQCPVSTPVMPIVQCPVVIVSVIESSHSQDSAACYEERVRFKCAPSLDLWLLSSTVVSNVLSSILHCPIKILSIERVVHPSTWLQPRNVYNRQRTQCGSGWRQQVNKNRLISCPATLTAGQPKSKIWQAAIEKCLEKNI